jgi:hypothetical protein
MNMAVMSAASSLRYANPCMMLLSALALNAGARREEFIQAAAVSL